jgi:hypothetical protein
MQSVSGQSRGGLVTKHYCLFWDYWVPLTTRRYYGGSILTSLHTGISHGVIQWDLCSQTQLPSTFHLDTKEDGVPVG